MYCSFESSNWSPQRKQGRYRLISCLRCGLQSKTINCLVSLSLCLLVFAAILSGAASAAEVSATRLDGTEFAGDLKTWNDSEVIVSTPDGDERVPIKQLVSLRFSALSEPATDESAPPQIELIDGSILPIEDARVAGSKAELTLSAVPAEKKTLTLPVKSVVAIRLQ
jgi:hypothetical protein